MTEARLYALPYDPIQGHGHGHKCLKATQEQSTVSPAWDKFYFCKEHNN